MERLKTFAGKRAVRWTFGILAGLLLLWTVGGFLIAPPILRHVAAKKASEALARKVEIAQVRLNPWALSLTVRGLRVNDRGSAEAFVSLGELYVRASWKSLFKLAPVITELRLAKPYLHVVREEDGRLNFSDLTEKKPENPPAEKKAAKPFLFSINNIQISGGEIALEDKTQHKSHCLSDIEVAVPSISNFPYFIQTNVQPRFSAALDGSPIRLDGTSKPFASSLETRVVLNLQDFDLPRYVGYAPMALPFQVPSGKLSLRVELAYLQSFQRAPSLTLWGEASLSQFQLNDAAGAKVLFLPEFRVVGFSAHPLLSRFYCQKVLIEQPDLSVTRDAQGRLNLLSLLPPAGPPAPKPAKATTPPTVEVNQISLSGAKVTFTDLANRNPFTTTLSPIDLELLHFSVSPDKRTAYRFSLATESGEKVSLDGEFSLTPAAVQGGLRVEGIVLGKYAPYYEDRILFNVEDGRLDLGCRYSATVPPAGPDVQLSEIGVALKSLRLREREEKEPFLTLPLFAVRGGSLDLPKRQLVLDDIYTEKLSVRVARFKDGGLSLQKLVPPAPKPASEPAAPVPAAETSPWQATIRRFEIKDYAVRVRDEVPATPVVLAVEQIGVKAENLTTAPGAQMSLSLGFRLDSGGSVAASGTFSLQPPAANLRCDVKQLNLAEFQPYVPPSAPVTLRSGLLSFGGDAVFANPATGMQASFKGDLALQKFAAAAKTAAVRWDALRLSGIEAAYSPPKTTFKGNVTLEQFAATDGQDSVQWGAFRLTGIEAGYDPQKTTFRGNLALEKFAAANERAGVQWDTFRLSGIEAGYAPSKTTFKGELELDKFAVIDKRAGENLLQWDALRLSGIEAGYAPLALKVAQVSLDKPVVRVVMGADGVPNVKAVFAGPAAQPAPAATPKEPPPAAAPSPEVTIGRIALKGGQFTFLDRSISPAYSMALDDMDGDVEGVSFDPKQTAKVNFSARMDNVAPLVMTGQFRPAKDDFFLELHTDFRGIELSPTTPYSDKYVGYPVTRGKLSLGLDYVIQKRKLDAKNRIFLDQFTLGDRVESPTATHAPVKFALALLRDRRGEIHLDVPISGSLDDPKFRVLPILVHVLVNIAEKAATSPFSLVGSLVGGGGGEEMSYIAFDYGSAALDPVAQKKLEGIVKLLDDRPALRLVLNPQIAPQRDTEALRREFMERKLKIQKLRETAGKEMTVSINNVKISPEEHDKYLKLAYDAEEIPGKPRNGLGIAKTIPPKQMEELLLAHTSVVPADLRLLAYKRAADIRDFLLASKAVEPERLFIAEPQQETASEAAAGAKPRTQFALTLGGAGAPPPPEKAFEPPPVTAQSSDTVVVKPRSSWTRKLLIGGAAGGAAILVIVLVVH